MSEESKKYREAMKSKAKRLAMNDPHEKVDASSWSPQELEGSQKQTGARVLSKRQYKKGGKVIGKAEGEKSVHRADRKPRASGGKLIDYIRDKVPAAKSEGGSLTADKLVNLDVRKANEKREGFKHKGSFAKGGKAKDADGDDENDPYAEEDSNAVTDDGKKRGGSVHGPNCMCKNCNSSKADYPDKMKSEGRTARGYKTVDEGRNKKGRTAHAKGGKVKGTKINIIIAGNPNQAQSDQPAPNAPVNPPMVAGPMPAMPPPPMPPSMPTGPMPPGAMGRASGGRTYPIEAASAGGLGRLEKIKAYGRSIMRRSDQR